MEGGDTDLNVDYDLYYKCDTPNQWLSVLHGFVVIKDYEPEENYIFPLF